MHHLSRVQVPQADGAVLRPREHQIARRAEARARTKLRAVFWWPLKARKGRAARTSHSRTELSFDEASSWVPAAWWVWGGEGGEGGREGGEGGREGRGGRERGREGERERGREGEREREEGEANGDVSVRMRMRHSWRGDDVCDQLLLTARRELHRGDFAERVSKLSHAERRT